MFQVHIEKKYVLKINNKYLKLAPKPGGPASTCHLLYHCHVFIPQTLCDSPRLIGFCLSRPNHHIIGNCWLLIAGFLVLASNTNFCLLYLCKRFNIIVPSKNLAGRVYHCGTNRSYVSQLRSMAITHSWPFCTSKDRFLGNGYWTNMNDLASFS